MRRPVTLFRWAKAQPTFGICLILSLSSTIGCSERPEPAESTFQAAPQIAPMTGNTAEAQAVVEATPVAATRPAYRSVKLERIPHVRQKPDFCGEACVAMWLGVKDHGGDQDWVFDQSDLDPIEGRGCYTRDLAKAAQAIGFKTGPIWSQVAVQQAAEQLEAHWQAMHADLLRGVPSIICMRYDQRPNTTEHFRLIVGYDANADEVLYHEPAVNDGAYQRMPLDLLLDLWPLKYDRDRWTVIRMRLDANRLAPFTSPRTFTPADYAQHIRQLKQRLPSDDFHLVIERPFVVIGDEKPETVDGRAAGTLRWAVERLKKQYFARDPRHILDVWLFADKASYEKNVPAIFGDEPGTPFGYYSPSDRALIMNISTGGGTLVHEIVHPFIESNFPKCPAWFNEGLGSLYEQSGSRNGRIVGYTNWRLAGLQRAIDRGRVPSFKTLTSTSAREFYNEDPGTNYAQARYLCYFLQERGLLQNYYREFTANVDEDPTGYATLKRVLGEDDMAAFQDRWEEYVSGLEFR